jgi:hypothetical protein
VELGFRKVDLDLIHRGEVLLDDGVVGLFDFIRTELYLIGVQECWEFAQFVLASFLCFHLF